jgi:3-dehydroquinate synthase
MTTTQTADAPIRIHVPLDTRAYDVLIGTDLIANTGVLVAERFGPRRLAIVTDRNLAANHLAAVERSLPAGRHAGTIVLTPGEPTKSFSVLQNLCEQLLSKGLERGDLVIALGGGVIGDLTGFAASILRRGMRFVQIPTSLLSQVDSSVGGKTGINTPQGKNLVGTFHQPSLVLADIGSLATLPDREMRAGYAEVAKYGLLGDPAFFDWLEQAGPQVLAREPASLTRAIARSVEMKADIVVRDETEQGDRALLNLGHTFGHALEAWAGFSSRLLHGEAVAIGCSQAFRFSEELQICPPGTAARVETHLRRVGLPSRIAHIDGPDRPELSRLMTLMSQDKKVRDGRLTFILARGIGNTYVARDIDAARVSAFLASEIERAP